MTMADERTYVIPLRKAILRVPLYTRTKRAMSEIRIFLKRHLKTENVKIGRYLNERMWEHSIKHPPTKITVNAAVDEDGIGWAELVGKPLFPPKKEKKGKEEEKAEETKPAAEKAEEKPKAEEKKPKAAKSLSEADSRKKMVAEFEEEEANAAPAGEETKPDVPAEKKPAHKKAAAPKD